MPEPAQPALLDIAHLSFLEVIRSLIEQSGATSAKGTLIRMAIKVGERLPKTDFPTLDAFMETLGLGTNPISAIEGKAVHLGGGLVALPRCPFAPAIKNYQRVFGSLPGAYDAATAEFNKPSPITDAHHIGSGAGVSPFCCVHQPLRSSAAAQITVGGKPVVIYELGCRSETGKKALADRWIAEIGLSPADVEKVLDSNMCCYLIKVAS